MRKFSFWIVLALSVLVGLMVFIHWHTLQGLHEKTVLVKPLYQRQKIVSSLETSLEKYRRMSSSFRKFEPDEIAQAKNHLRSAFSEGVTQLNRLSPTSEERSSGNLLSEQLTELLSLIANVEPTLFSKDSYQKPEVQARHNEILKTLSSLGKGTDSRFESLHSEVTQTESRSVILLGIVGSAILILLLGLILRSQFVYVRPLKKLSDYAAGLGVNKPLPANPPHFAGLYDDIQKVLNQLALGVETHMRDRHKFILDVVADLKLPLTLLQSGKYLLGANRENAGQEDEAKQIEAAESVRRGLAIFAGSLEDLNDIVDINRLESRLEESTVDLSELLSDVSRTLLGPEQIKNVTFTVPPIPVWAKVDVRRFERVFMLILAKTIETLGTGGKLGISVGQVNQGSFRGIEIQFQDQERMKQGRASMSGPEQDLLKHWISENGLALALAHKIIKAHGGSVHAAGIAGTSATIVVRLPQERIISRGLISPPVQEGGLGLRGAIRSPQASPAVEQGSQSQSRA